MALQWSAYGVVPLLTAALLAGLAAYVWRSRATPAGATFVALLGAISFWLVAAGFNRLCGDLPLKLVLAKLSWVGVVSVAPLCLAVALRATGRGGWLTRRRLLGLAAPPALVFGLAATNELHGWVWSGVSLAPGGPYPLLDLAHGPVFWLHAAWAHLLLLASCALLVDHYRRNWSFYRGEAFAVLGGMAAPWLANAFYLAGLRPFEHVDVTPYGFALTGVALALNLGRGRSLLDWVRVARDEIVEEISDGVLVVDLRDRLVYANRAATRVLELPGGSRSRSAARVLAHQPELAAYLGAGGDCEGEISIGEGEERRSYDLNVTLLRDPQGRPASRVVVLRDITEHKRSELRSRALAYTDVLTGLPNRQRFTRVLANAIDTARRRGTKLALLFVDLDGFKDVNDSCGHGVGDALLIEVARRLSECLRFSDFLGAPGRDADDVISRLGGDEFTVLLSELASPVDAARVARRLLGALAEPFEIEGHELFASASIGIAVFPVDGKDPDALLCSADRAMYYSKRRGRNQYEFFTPAMTTAGTRRLELEGRLRRALERDELALFYQPLRDTRSGRVTALEALMRWQCPRFGPVSPDVFIPIAEETGLIAPIGAWALHTACAQMRAWEAEGYRPVRLAVNLSGHQLRNRGLLDTLTEVLEETGLSPALLELEVNENSILRDDGVTPVTLAGLRELGVGLALDDFGTGYSSLSYLRRFRFDRLKIDRSFVAAVAKPGEGRTLTAAIIAMAHALELPVVAEGVETHEQLLSLRELGCEELQGHLLSPALPAEDVKGFLERQKEQ